MTKCKLCNRKLTRKESIRNEMGPLCNSSGVKQLNLFNRLYFEKVACYTYRILERQQKFLLIYEDSDNNSISLTNSIERVIKEICYKEKINYKDYIIIQYDINGEYDLVKIDKNGKPFWKYLHHNKKDGFIILERLLKKAIINNS